MSALESIEDLLVPISEESPAGSDIREDSSHNSIYRRIKEARSAARSAERNNLFMDEDELSSQNANRAEEYWQTIEELAPEILKNHAKDLEVACWYTEALVRSYKFRNSNNFQGLRIGFDLLLQLTEKYWEHLFPLPDEDGLETKVAPLAGLNGEGGEGTLIAPLRNLRISHPNTIAFTYWDTVQAQEDDNIKDEDKKERRLKAVKAKGGLLFEDIKKAINGTDPLYFKALLNDINGARESFNKLDALLYDHCQGYAPPTRNIKETLETISLFVQHIAKDRLELLPDDEIDIEEELPEGDESMANNDAKESTKKDNYQSFNAKDINPVEATIHTREEALKQLLKIAEFFHKTEPHSPVSYSLKKTVRWAKMPLDELLRELIPDKNTQDSLSSLTGIMFNEEEN